MRGKADYTPALVAVYGDGFARDDLTQESGIASPGTTSPISDLTSPHPTSPRHTQESGQLLVHKSRCIAALGALTVLNSNTRRGLVYAGLHGDKDTFRIAWTSAGASYHDVSQRPMLGGFVDCGKSGVFRDVCFVQPGLDGAPLFCHYCGRQRDDDDERLEHGRWPPSVMTAVGRPFRLWPHDMRRGYMMGEVTPLVISRSAAAVKALKT